MAEVVLIQGLVPSAKHLWCSAAQQRHIQYSCMKQFNEIGCIWRLLSAILSIHQMLQGLKLLFCNSFSCFIEIIEVVISCNIVGLNATMLRYSSFSILNFSWVRIAVQSIGLQFRMGKQLYLASKHWIVVLEHLMWSSGHQDTPMTCSQSTKVSTTTMVQSISSTTRMMR